MLKRERADDGRSQRDDEQQDDHRQRGEDKEEAKERFGHGHRKCLDKEKASLKRWRDSAPLCPAGHLPRKGGDWLMRRTALILLHPRLMPNVDEGVISPLAGEMPGRAEGGDVERPRLWFCFFR
ncbi:hypothetical protein GCM10011491_14040 [Brucella endophytica]|uniref:Uncharacterized protein n=1 Tax=Brucella endophytica TaxID=1963359 RepID=A0A916S729_9HYPH|nr:hypothetical protein GCM10011491_14040 [Brucella endophytica]